MDWAIQGHEKQLKLLENALKRGKLAHAYVFAGPEGVGKKIVARRLAWEMLEMGEKEKGEAKGVMGESEHGFFHPDLLEIDGAEGIKIEQIRDLTYKLALKPYSAKHKVALIDQAQNMTVEAANALLKVLEEPKSYTYIFLIASNAQRLPKTILSRCQKITFGPVSERSDGSKNSEESDRSEQFFKIFQKGKLADKLIAAYDIADLETPQIKKLLDLWLASMQDELHQNATKRLAQRISQVMLSRKYLEQNVNTKLLLTNLMINT